MALYKTLVNKISIPADKKTKQKEYLAKGKLAIVDQGQELIGGYSDDIEKTILCDLPVIVFGDHTRAVKYINFKFGAGADGIKILKPKDGVLPKYLYYGTIYLTIKMPDRGYARHYQHVEKMDLPLPPLEEQRRIVSEIEKLISTLDDGVATLEKTREQLKVYRQAVLKEAFDSVPNIEAQPLENYLKSIEGGKSFKCVEIPPNKDEYGIIKVSAVTWGIFNEDESKTCKPEQFVEEKRIRVGDFLFGRANTLQLIGNCVIVKKLTKNLMMCDKVFRFDFEDTLLPEYLLYFLRSKNGKQQIQLLSTGNQESMRNIGQDRIKKIKISVPSLKIQRQIVDKIEGKLSVCDSIEASVDKALEEAEAMRQSILKQAFEGKL